MKKKTVLLSITILAVMVLFLTVPPLHDWVVGIWELFKDPKAMRECIAACGPLAPMVSALLMVFQCIVAPLPAFLIAITNGVLFGVWWGAALSWSSALVGATLCFFIARRFGRPIVIKLISESTLAATDGFFSRYGKYAILIARLVPVISFDAISYAAGLTGMRFLGFGVATGIGQLPATILYAYLGDQMTGTIPLLFWALGVVIAVFIVMALILLSRSKFQFVPFNHRERS